MTTEKILVTVGIIGLAVAAIMYQRATATREQETVKNIIERNRDSFFTGGSF